MVFDVPFFGALCLIYNNKLILDNDCQSDPARSRRKVFSNRCSFQGCKAKEMVPVICKDCNQNYCLKHRFQNDHKCMGKMSVRQTIQK